MSAEKSGLTFEECITLIDGVKDEQNIDNIKAVLTKVKAALADRINRRAKEKASDGGEAVKRAITSGRTFKPYQPQPMPTTEPKANAWG